ncbi:MAG: CapA family protein, partial [Butyricicoccus sp.]|nr:CapA family protein [Butyricicoccus sp.]
SAVYMSTWAENQVQSAYESGAVSEDFDLGTDYTRPITRGELARLTVDLIAHERQVSMDDLIAQFGIALQAPSLTPAQPAESEESSEPPVEDNVDTSEQESLETDTDVGEPPAEESTDTNEPAMEEPEEGTPAVETPTEAEEPWGDPLDNGLPFVATGSFTDTKSVYIEIAAQLGIVSGSDGLFRPADPVTRAEAAAMMERCMGALGFSEANQVPQQFADSYEIPRWAVISVKYISGRTDAGGQAIMGGWDGKFHPMDTYTVEQAILSVQRMQSSLAIQDVYAGWRDTTGYNSVQLALTFGGDCTFGRNRGSAYSNSFDEIYDQKGAAYFFSGIPEFFSDDLTMVNFEGTLTTSNASASKTFVFKGNPAYAKILEDGSIDVVTLANNHSMDYLQSGYDDTVRYLSPYVDVSAYGLQPIVTVKGVRIGFVSNVGWSFDALQKQFITLAIQNLRARGADIIVFNYHWGVEKSYHSNATQQAIGRYCIDQGADLVIGHHPHVAQEVEIYQGKPIVYSLGNLVFGGNRNPSDKNCLIFRQNYTFDLDTRTISDSSYQAIPYKISSVSWRNDYHPTK